MLSSRTAGAAHSSPGQPSLPPPGSEVHWPSARTQGYPVSERPPLLGARGPRDGSSEDEEEAPQPGLPLGLGSTACAALEAVPESCSCLRPGPSLSENRWAQAMSSLAAAKSREAGSVRRPSCCWRCSAWPGAGLGVPGEASLGSGTGLPS